MEAREIVALHVDLYPPEIARLEHMPVTTVRAVLRREGVRPRAARGTPPWHDRVSHVHIARCRFLYEDVGLSCRQIGEIVGRDWSCVRKTLLKAGVTLRGQAEGRWLAERWRGRALPTIVA